MRYSIESLQLTAFCLMRKKTQLFASSNNLYVLSTCSHLTQGMIRSSSKENVKYHSHQMFKSPWDQPTYLGLPCNLCLFAVYMTVEISQTKSGYSVIYIFLKNLFTLYFILVLLFFFFYYLSTIAQKVQQILINLVSIGLIC